MADPTTPWVHSKSAYSCQPNQILENLPLWEDLFMMAPYGPTQGNWYKIAHQHSSIDSRTQFFAKKLLFWYTLYAFRKGSSQHNAIWYDCRFKDWQMIMVLVFWGSIYFLVLCSCGSIDFLYFCVICFPRYTFQFILLCLCYFLVAKVDDWCTHSVWAASLYYIIWAVLCEPRVAN